MLFFVGSVSFPRHIYILVTFEKPARLVGVFKTEKRKRASERETRDVFRRERFSCARFRQHALLSREKRSFNQSFWIGYRDQSA